MGSARLGAFVWPGMVLVGLALAAAVYVAWPEPTVRERAPGAASRPQASTAAKQRPAPHAAARPEARPVPAAAAVPAPPASRAEPRDAPARSLAGVEPVTEDVDVSAGPPPVASQTELADDYVQEPPEQLGAEPLPGVEPTPSPPVAG